MFYKLIIINNREIKGNKKKYPLNIQFFNIFYFETNQIFLQDYSYNLYCLRGNSMSLTDNLLKEVKKQTKKSKHDKHHKKHKSHEKSGIPGEVEKMAKKELKKRLKF